MYLEEIFNKFTDQTHNLSDKIGEKKITSRIRVHICV